MKKSITFKISSNVFVTQVDKTWGEQHLNVSGSPYKIRFTDSSSKFWQKNAFFIDSVYQKQHSVYFVLGKGRKALTIQSSGSPFLVDQ